MNAKYKVIIVGAGIVGHCAAYHLTQLGCRNILVIDKGDLLENDGSTSHAPGGVVALSHSKLLTQMAQHSTKLYRDLAPYSAQRNTYNAVGGLEVARTQARWEDLVRLNGEAKSYGVEAHLMSAQEVQVRLWPLINPHSFVGALFVPSSAIVAGANLSGALLNATKAAGNVTYLAKTRVVDVETVRGQVSAVLTDNPETARIECQQVLLCTNIWAPPIQAKAGINLPLMAFEHQYTITNARPALSQFDPAKRDDEIVYPTARDLDYALYYRQHWNSLGVGSYHHAPHMVHPVDVGKDAKHPFTPGDFEFAWRAANEMFPLTEGATLETAFNGMFAFSVDGMPIIGETHVKGLWAAVASWITHAGGVGKSIAELMTHGESEWDLRQASIDRFLPFQKMQNYVTTVCRKNYREVYDLIHPKQPISEPRNVRLTPFHARLQELGAVFTSFAGLELPNWLEVNAPLLEKYGEQIPQRSGWAAKFWSPIQGVEHLETRQNVAMFDLTGLSIIEVTGHGALAYMNYLCSNQLDRPLGSVVYTTWLTPRGGVKRDLTVARLSDERFWLFVGDGTRPQDFAWVQRHAPNDGTVQIGDISDSYSAIGVWGPNARKVLEKVTTADLGNDTFPFYTCQWIDVGLAPALALRISYAGELGWELHIPMDASLPVWDALWDAGREFDMIAAGMGAFDSLRLEKGYRLWGGDVYTEQSPYDAGLGWTVRTKKERFIGRDAAIKAKEKGPDKKLCCLVSEAANALVLGYEPIFDDGTCIGHVTTGNYGYSVGKLIAYGYLPIEYAVPGTKLEIEYCGQRFPVAVCNEPLWDPKMKRMRA